MSNDNLCPICLDELNDENKICNLKCNHVFHEDCINKWLTKKSTCPYCRMYLNDILTVSYKEDNSMFMNKATLIFPKNNSLEIKIIFLKKIFSKTIIINRFNLKCFTIFNNNRVVIKYFVKIPDKTKILILFFNTYDDLNECCKYFRKMFEYNQRVKQEGVAALL